MTTAEEEGSSVQCSTALSGLSRAARPFQQFLFFLLRHDRENRNKSRIRAYVPTDTPMSQHMNTLVGKEGMAPQMEVAMKRMVESRMEYLHDCCCWDCVR